MPQSLLCGGGPRTCHRNRICNTAGASSTPLGVGRRQIAAENFVESKAPKEGTGDCVDCPHGKFGPNPSDASLLVSVATDVTSC